MARNSNGKNSELATVPKVDLAFLNIPSVDELLDLSEIEQPLVKIEDYLEKPVVILGGEKRESNGQFATNVSHYYILDVQDIQTGETWKSSCGHWFMAAYIKHMEEQGKPPFPVALRFYKDGSSIKFKGVKLSQGEIPF